MSTKASALASSQPGAAALLALADRFRATGKSLAVNAETRTAAAKKDSAIIVAREQNALAAEDGVIRSSLRTIRSTAAMIASLDFDQLRTSASQVLAGKDRAVFTSSSMKLPFRRAERNAPRPATASAAPQHAGANDAPLPVLQPARSARR